MNYANKMAMKLTNFQRTLALGQIRAGIRHRDVAPQSVAPAFHVDVRAIRGIQVRYNQTNDVKNRPRTGRPKVTARREENWKLLGFMAVLFP